MEYVTAGSFNDFLIIWRTYWLVFIGISMTWCISSIIIDLVKMYTFKDDKKEIFKSLFSILKSIVYLIPMGMLTAIVAEAYNEGINFDSISKIVVVIVAIIAILISIIYKKYTSKDLKAISSNEELTSDEKEDK